jgi:hypothetical protein
MRRGASGITRAGAAGRWRCIDGRQPPRRGATTRGHRRAGAPWRCRSDRAGCGASGRPSRGARTLASAGGGRWRRACRETARRSAPLPAVETAGPAATRAPDRHRHLIARFPCPPLQFPGSREVSASPLQLREVPRQSRSVLEHAARPRAPTTILPSPRRSAIGAPFRMARRFMPRPRICPGSSVVEQTTENRRVGGSTPPLGTTSRGDVVSCFRLERRATGAARCSTTPARGTRPRTLSPTGWRSPRAGGGRSCPRDWPRSCSRDPACIDLSGFRAPRGAAVRAPC